MLKARTVKRWYAVHKWTSIVCTLFLLMLCLTGLPLIFHHELEPVLSTAKAPDPAADGLAPLNYDELLRRVQADHPQDAFTYLIHEAGEDRILFVGLNSAPEADPRPK